MFNLDKVSQDPEQENIEAPYKQKMQILSDLDSPTARLLSEFGEGSTPAAPDKDLKSGSTSAQVPPQATPPEAEPTISSDAPEPANPRRDIGAVMQGFGWLVRPLGAIQEAAIAPIVKKDYKSDTFFGKTAEAFGESFKALIGGLFPKLGETRPDYEETLLKDLNLDNMHPVIKETAKAAIQVISDPAAATLPFKKVLTESIKRMQVTGDRPGLFRGAVEEVLSYLPTKPEETNALLELAKKADAGDVAAGKELASKIVKSEHKFADDVAGQINEATGYDKRPVVDIIKDEPHALLDKKKYGINADIPVKPDIDWIQPEHVVRTGIRTAEDGKIFEGAAHADAAGSMLDYMETSGKMYNWNSVEKGFLTNTGRFISLEEARSLGVNRSVDIADTKPTLHFNDRFTDFAEMAKKYDDLKPGHYIVDKMIIIKNDDGSIQRVRNRELWTDPVTKKEVLRPAFTLQQMAENPRHGNKKYGAIERQMNKDLVSEKLKSGDYTPGMAIRSTTTSELEYLIRNRKLRVSEEHGIIHATPLTGGLSPPAYGNIEKHHLFVVVPEKYTQTIPDARAVETAISLKAPVEDMKFIAGGREYTFDEIAKLRAGREVPFPEIRTIEEATSFGLAMKSHPSGSKMADDLVGAIESAKIQQRIANVGGERNRALELSLKIQAMEDAMEAYKGTSVVKKVEKGDVLIDPNVNVKDLKFIVDGKEYTFNQLVLKWNERPLLRSISERYIKTEVERGQRRAYNINFNYIKTTDDIEAAITKTAAFWPQEMFSAARGVVSHQETLELAQVCGVSPEVLLKRMEGQTYNAQELVAARQLLVSSAERLESMAFKLKSGMATDLEKFQFKRQLGVHYAIQSQVTGAVAEAGRALNAMKIEAASTTERLKMIDDFMKAGTDGMSIDAMADAIISMKGDLNKISGWAAKQGQVKSSHMFLEAWINGLLSGPVTHMANIISNSLTIAWMIPERMFAAGWALAFKSDTQFRESVEMLYGLMEGFKDGFHSFGRTIMTGESIDPMTKLEMTNFQAITSDNIRKMSSTASKWIKEGGSVAQGIDLLGSAVRSPGRLLTAEDSFFKTIGYRMELRRLSYKQAVSEGLQDSGAVANRIAEIMTMPERFAPDLHLAAIDAARYMTYTNSLGDVGRSIQNVAGKHPVFRVVLPFIRTPTNILKFTLERSPMAPFMPSWRKAFKAGGAERDLAMAKLSLGSMVMGAAAMMTANGHITGGGPVDPDMRNIKRNTGWVPYSIKIGDQYYSYNRLEPIGMVLGLAADVVEICGQIGEVEASELAAAAVIAMSKNTTSKTWLKGMSEALRAWGDPDIYAVKYIHNFVASLVPAGLSQIERAIDPEISAVYSMMDAIKQRVPGWSRSLYPRRNIWGEPIVPPEGWGPDILSPIYTNSKTHSSIDEELIRLKMPIGMPKKVISIEGVDVDLESDGGKKYDKYITTMNQIRLPSTGKPLKMSLDEMVIRDSTYRRASDDIKELMISALLSEAKDLAKQVLKREFSDINLTIKQGHMEKAK
jgi:hypothetical protein